MLYLICRADQVPLTIHEDEPAKMEQGSWYPRFVLAESAEDAIRVAFAPESYKPAGKRELVVLEIESIQEFTSQPIEVPQYKLSRHTRRRRLLPS